MTGCVLRLYTDTDARRDGQPMYRWLMHEARASGAVQAFAFHATSGFGRSGRLKEIRFPEVQSQEPLVVEVYGDSACADALRARLASAGVDAFFVESAAAYAWSVDADVPIG